MDAQVESNAEASEHPTLPQKPRHHAFKKLLFSGLVILFIVAGACGTYYWQHSKLTSANQDVTELNSHITELQKQSATSKAKSSSTSSKGTVSSTFIYAPKTGGLSLTLPKTYEVLVGADGNDGGAPGASFKIVPVNDTNISSDTFFGNEIEVDVSNTFSNLNQSVRAAELGINQNTSSTAFKVSNTTVAGLPAKLITIYQDEYAGTLNTYVVGSGVWEYKITAHVLTYTNTPPPNILTDLLHGMTIKSAAD